MNLRVLRSFIAVAEELNFTRAAQRLHLAQPALSQQISQLEQDLDVALLERTKRSVRLTRAGRVYLEYARALVEDLDLARRSAQRAARGEEGRIAVGFATAARDLIPSAVRAFRESLPNVEVVLSELETQVQLNDLVRGAIDLAIAYDTLDTPDLEDEVLRRDRFVLALPAEHRLAGREVIDLAEIRDEPLILPGERTSAPLRINRDIAAACARAGFVPVPSYRGRDQGARLVLVAAGLGVSFVIDRRVPKDADGIVFRPIAGPPIAAPLLVIWRHRAEDPLVIRFREIIRRLSNKTTH